MAYLTGYDPRFEEALLVVDVDSDGRPTIMVGNEGLGYLDVSPVKDHLNTVLYQSFSLMGQDRSMSKPLTTILGEAGVAKGSRVGVAGWKYYTGEDSPNPESCLESYLADAGDL